MGELHSGQKNCLLAKQLKLFTWILTTVYEYILLHSGQAFLKKIKIICKVFCLESSGGHISQKYSLVAKQLKSKLSIFPESLGPQWQ